MSAIFYIIDKLLEKLIQDSAGKLILDRKSFEKELNQVINHSIQQYEKDFESAPAAGKIAFYKSQIFIDELLKFSFFQDYDYSNIITELIKNENIALPSKIELDDFIKIFNQNIAKNATLRNLEVDENYKLRIYQNSQDLKYIKDKIDSSLQKELDDIKNLLAKSNKAFIEPVLLSASVNNARENVTSEIVIEKYDKSANQIYFPEVDFKFINKGNIDAFLWKFEVEVLEFKAVIRPFLECFLRVNDFNLEISIQNLGWGAAKNFNFTFSDGLINDLFSNKNLFVEEVKPSETRVIGIYTLADVEKNIFSAINNNPEEYESYFEVIDLDGTRLDERLNAIVQNNPTKTALRFKKFNAKIAFNDENGIGYTEQRSIGYFDPKDPLDIKKVGLIENIGFVKNVNFYRTARVDSDMTYPVLLDEKSLHEKIKFDISRNVPKSGVDRFQIKFGARKTAKFKVRLIFYFNEKEIVYSQPIPLESFVPNLEREVNKLVYDPKINHFDSILYLNQKSDDLSVRQLIDFERTRKNVASFPFSARLTSEEINNIIAKATEMNIKKSVISILARESRQLDPVAYTYDILQHENLKDHEILNKIINTSHRLRRIVLSNPNLTKEMLLQIREDAFLKDRVEELHPSLKTAALEIPIFKAVINADFDEFKGLLANNRELSRENEIGESLFDILEKHDANFEFRKHLIFLICTRGAITDGSYLKEVIKRKWNLNVRNDQGQTPLMLTIQKDYLSLILLLLHAGVDLHAVDNTGRGAKHYIGKINIAYHKTRKANMFKLKEIVDFFK